MFVVVVGDRYSVGCFTIALFSTENVLRFFSSFHSILFFVQLLLGCVVYLIPMAIAVCKSLELVGVYLVICLLWILQIYFVYYCACPPYVHECEIVERYLHV